MYTTEELLELAKNSKSGILITEPEGKYEPRLLKRRLVKEGKSEDCFPIDKWPICPKFDECRAVFECRLKEVRLFSEQIAARIKAIPERTNFVHGDFHPQKVMLQNNAPILIDMGETCCGHPLYDLMTFGLHRVLCDVVTDELALNLAGMDCAQARRVWDKFLKAYFSDRTDEELKEINNVVVCYSAIRAWVVVSQFSAFPPQLGEYCLGVVRKLAAEGGTDLFKLKL